MSRLCAVVASTAVAMASSAELEKKGLLKMRGELKDALSGPGGHVPVTRPTLITEEEEVEVVEEMIRMATLP